MKRSDIGDCPAPAGIISLQGERLRQECLGAITPLQTGGFVGMPEGSNRSRGARASRG